MQHKKGELIAKKFDHQRGVDRSATVLDAHEDEDLHDALTRQRTKREHVGGTQVVSRFGVRLARAVTHPEPGHVRLSDQHEQLLASREEDGQAHQALVNVELIDARLPLVGQATGGLVWEEGSRSCVS